MEKDEEEEEKDNSDTVSKDEEGYSMTLDTLDREYNSPFTKALPNL